MQLHATHLVLTEDVVLPLISACVHYHTLGHNVRDLTAVQNVRTVAHVSDVINVLVCKTGAEVLVPNVRYISIKILSKKLNRNKLDNMLVRHLKVTG